MGRINALLIPAKVVKNHPIGYRANLKNISNPMRDERLPPIGNVPISATF